MEGNYDTGEQSAGGLFDDFSQMSMAIPATTGQRFLNFLIDNLLMRFGLSYVTGTLIGYLLVKLFPDFIQYYLQHGAYSAGVILLAYVIAIFNYIIYYTFCEKVFNGYTLGKLVTGSRAVRNDGQELTFKDTLLRSVIRLVPFEPLSGFGTPWHDAWTNTTVIKTR
ncbi:MAG TPA: RDD family protein [Chitinophagaceae bacterium]|nr:RDD family protein [Chitinophagaceae bacterium]